MVTLRKEVQELAQRKREALEANALLRQLNSLWERTCAEVEAEIQEGVKRKLGFGAAEVAAAAAAPPTSGLLEEALREIKMEVKQEVEPSSSPSSLVEPPPPLLPLQPQQQAPLLPVLPAASATPRSKLPQSAGVAPSPASARPERAAKRRMPPAVAATS